MKVVVLGSATFTLVILGTLDMSSRSKASFSTLEITALKVVFRFGRKMPREFAESAVDYTFRKFPDTPVAERIPDMVLNQGLNHPKIFPRDFAGLPRATWRSNQAST